MVTWICKAVLNASIIITDVPMHLGSMHDSFALHMFPLNQLLWIFSPDGGWLIVQALSYFPPVYSGDICVQSLQTWRWFWVVNNFLFWWQATLSFSIPLNTWNKATVRLHVFHCHPEAVGCLSASVVSCGALVKLMAAPILPGGLGWALAGVALNFVLPAGRSFMCVRHCQYTDWVLHHFLHF